MNKKPKTSDKTSITHRVAYQLEEIIHGTYSIRIDAGMAFDLLNWDIRELKRTLNRKYYLQRKYEGFWLGKLCRPAAVHPIDFRVVEKIVIKQFLNKDGIYLKEYDEVHVFYPGRWTHRVIKSNYSHGLPLKSDLVIKDEI